MSSSLGPARAAVGHRLSRHPGPRSAARQPLRNGPAASHDPRQPQRPRRDVLGSRPSPPAPPAAAPAPPAPRPWAPPARPSALCSVIAADRHLKWMFSAQWGRREAGRPQPERCRGARAALLTGSQRGDPSCVSSPFLMGYLGIDCTAPTVRGSPGCSNIPPQSCPEHPACRQGRGCTGSSHTGPRAGQAPRLSLSW